MKNEGTLPEFENGLHDGTLIIRKRVTTSGPEFDPDTAFHFKVRSFGPTVEDRTVIYDVSTIEDSQSGGELGETPSTPGEEFGERKSCNIKAVLIYCKNIEAEGCALCHPSASYYFACLAVEYYPTCWNSGMFSTPRATVIGL